MRVPQPDIIEHFGNADAVPQPPERCLSRQAGIVRCCPRCNNTHDFVPKSCAKDAAPPLESPLTPPMGDVGSPHRREGLRKGAPRLFAARERYFCGNVITHYDTFSHAVCKV